MKKTLVIVFLFLTIQLQAQVRIGEKEALSTAELFLRQNAKQQNPVLSLNEIVYSPTTPQPNLFVFSIEPQGFVIVTAMNEVLAYSLTSTMPKTGGLPDPIAYWLELYNEQTDFVAMHPDQVRKPLKGMQSVGPLLTSVWGQGCYHNALCPQESSGPCHHVEAGCVAIAMAQIMYYHKEPIKGIGSMTYSCSPYGILSADFGATTYQWDDMVDTVNQNNYSSVAQLIKHCGISVQMNYGAHSSYSSSTKAVEAFRYFFSYPTATLSQRTYYSDEEWLSLIKEDLDRHLPVYYSGTSSLGKHAFVCDGYDDNGLFHFNFGWDGVADGFYSIDNPYGFSVLQTCIHSIIPAADIPIHSDSHGIIYVTPDGDGDGSSWEEATSDIQAAIYKSHASSDVIWVKEGSYIGEPIQGYAYNMFGNCRLYGGFIGDEPYDYDLSLRDFETHPSILDGNHSHGIFNVQNAVNRVIIDGFTIQNCHAQNGGILVKCLAHIKNCKFRDNYSKSSGGGLSQQSPYSERVIIEDCEFVGNEAKYYGGGLYDQGNTKCFHCRFSDNLAQMDGGGIHCRSYETPSQYYSCIISNNRARNGGGVSTINQGATFWSCLICNNTAETGGGCHLEDSTKLLNCTIVKNEAQDDYGGVYITASSPRIQNCIVWGNVSEGDKPQIGPVGTYSHCAIQNNQRVGEQNYKAANDNDGGSPKFYVRFQDPNTEAGYMGQGGDWRLQSNSLCINRGTNFAEQSSADLDGNSRRQHEIVDLGAYESNTAVTFVMANLCEDGAYYYQDSLLNALGIYTSLHGGQPCDSLTVIQMQDPPSTEVILTEEICENETYDFFGTLITEPGQYTAIEQCVTYRLRLTTKPIETITMEKEICAGDTYDFFGETLFEEGHYSTIYDCKAYELDLTISPTPLTFMSLNEEICEGDTYVFFDKTLHYGGHYSTTVDCIKYDLELSVLTRPPLRVCNDTIIEYGNPVQLTASGADAYLWSTGENTASIIVSPTKDETYYVEGFALNGCSKKASITVQVKEKNDGMILFPNPASEKVTVNCAIIDEVDVFNLYGDHVAHADANREAVELDVSQFADGIYIIQVRQMKNLYYEKLIIVH